MRSHWPGSKKDSPPSHSPKSKKNLAWIVEFDVKAKQEFKSLDRPVQKRIQRFIHERLETTPDPRTLGRALTGSYAGFWRFRVGDYRLICDVQDKKVMVLVLRIGHRKEIYQ